jgi:phenylpropionate dioxygenase-like ring-hydroxylating dioxygenase large terminal subunit
VLERNGQLFVWNDPQGNPLPEEVTIPEIPGFGSPEWTSWTWNSLTIEGSHCREIVDNVVDMAHFFYIHWLRLRRTPCRSDRRDAGKSFPHQLSRSRGSAHCAAWTSPDVVRHDRGLGLG